MRFVEVDLFGVYVAPIVPMMAIAWVVLLVVRRIANRSGLLRFVWHPSLFMFAIYLVVLSCIVLLAASRGRACPM